MEKFGAINGEEEILANQSHAEALKALSKRLWRMNVCQRIRMFGFQCVSGSALVKMNLDESYSCFWMSAVCLANQVLSASIVKIVPVLDCRRVSEYVSFEIMLAVAEYVQTT